MVTKTTAPTANIIVADNASSLVSAAFTIGQKGQELFFKYGKPYEEAYSGEQLRMNGLNIHTYCTKSWFPILTSEFAILCEIYNVIPENAAMPITLVRRSERRSDRYGDRVDGYPIAGYIAEYVEGQTLDKYYDRAQVGALAAVQEFAALVVQYIKLLDRLNGMGIGHGDAHLGNAIVTDKKILKVIDPMDWNIDPESATAEHDRRQRAISHDRKNVSKMELMLRCMVKNGNRDLPKFY